jgi:hypothetical protein
MWKKNKQKEQSSRTIFVIDLMGRGVTGTKHSVALLALMC